MLDLLYGHLAQSRRRYYEQRPHLIRRLDAPVISIGNLTVGGTGKTPLTAEIARVLIAMGERPAILSRGYARLNPLEGVVIVSDGDAIQTDVAHAGDEPYMLAGMVPGAAVLVCSSRYVAGRLAESRLGCTVHLLDDGFQHIQLARDVDLLVALPEDFGDIRMLPFGRFREPLDAARIADALLVPAAGVSIAADLSERLHVATAFGFDRSVQESAPGARAFAFAGIAKPDRFFTDLENAGWDVAGRRAFVDHHHYSSREIDAIRSSARESGANVIVTTSKDYVRLPAETSTDGDAMAIVEVRLATSIEPALAPWLRARLEMARAA